VITMLFDADSVAEVVSGPLSQGLLEGAVWLQTTTVGLQGTQRLAGLAAAAGGGVVDAPVLGTKKPAEDGTLSPAQAGRHTIRRAPPWASGARSRAP